MFLNIIIGFVIPCIFGFILYFKNKKILCVIYPFQSMIAYTIIMLEIDVGFWKLEPDKYFTLPAIPFCLGLYPVCASYLVYFIDKNKTRPYLLIIFFTMINTVAEGLGILVGRVHYKNGWNIFFTFLSYLFPHILCYMYYLWLKKYKILNKLR